MPFIRRHGKQLELVHGVRKPGSRSVEQHVLFTFYSKAEALDALGDGDPEEYGHFRSLVEHNNPGMKFDWSSIAKGLRDNLEHLPETYDYRGTRVEERFDRSLVEFTRELALADPQWLQPAAEHLCVRTKELKFLAELVSWRLEVSESGPSTWLEDNRYYWLSALRDRHPPCDAEDVAVGFFERGEHDEAEGGFRLLTAAFEAYPEGHNYLGLIALDRDRPEEAEGHFRRAVELGRRQFPRRIARGRYWSDHETRPYIRGLFNLAQTLTQLRRYDEALEVCATLEREGGPSLSPHSYRAVICLSTGNWEQALSAALIGYRLHPEDSFVAAFALFELGRGAEAAGHFLHAILNRPISARRLLGLRPREVKGFRDNLDFDAGIFLVRTLGGYLEGPRHRPAIGYLAKLLVAPGVNDLLKRIQLAEEARQDRDPDRSGTALLILNALREPGFAFEQAGALGLAELDRREAPAGDKGRGRAKAASTGRVPRRKA